MSQPPWLPAIEVPSGPRLEPAQAQAHFDVAELQYMEEALNMVDVLDFDALLSDLDPIHLDLPSEPGLEALEREPIPPGAGGIRMPPPPPPPEAPEAPEAGAEEDEEDEEEDEEEEEEEEEDEDDHLGQEGHPAAGRAPRDLHLQPR
jgi:hypothetical protein